MKKYPLKSLFLETLLVIGRIFFKKSTLPLIFFWNLELVLDLVLGKIPFEKSKFRGSVDLWKDISYQIQIHKNFLQKSNYGGSLEEYSLTNPLRLIFFNPGVVLREIKMVLGKISSKNQSLLALMVLGRIVFNQFTFSLIFFNLGLVLRSNVLALGKIRKNPSLNALLVPGRKMFKGFTLSLKKC